ncbi:MAG: hypothetical protein U9R68_02590 [Planctomycetota bacterium]|nr:hypothetical protein [Planctomycetota bacterium]
MDPLIASLTRIRRRLLAVRAVEAGLAGAVVAAAPALVVTGLRIAVPRVLPATLAHPAAALALVPCGFVAAMVVRLVAGTSLRRASRAADEAAGLDDRLATALEVLERRRFQEALSGLDGRLLADARQAAGRLDPRAMPLARTASRRGRAALVAAVVLAALAMVPSLAGPPVDGPAADRAARALAPLAEDESLAPAVRQAVRRAVADLRHAGARRQDAEQRTAAVYRAAAEARRARDKAAAVLASAPADEVRRMVRAAGTGDAPGAEAAARDLADSLTGGAGGGNMGPAERERLGDTLDAAVPHARDGGLADLQRALADAADAVRGGDTERVREALDRLAAALPPALGPRGGVAVAAAVETVDRARRAMGLPPVPEVALAAGPGASAGGAPAGEGGPEAPRASAGDVTAGGGGAGAVTVPDEVRAEDRDVVRRYFGG